MKPADLAADLAQRQPSALRVTGVPNARLARDFALLRRLETLDPAAFDALFERKPG
jgi:hypothetical protein